MNRFNRLIVFALFFFTLTLTAKTLAATFEAAEHISIGDNVKLRFDSSVEGQTGIRLTLANGLSLTYGEIVSLAGDFYGVPDSPIILGNTEEIKKQRFIAAYQTLAVQSEAVVEVPKILAVMQDEKRQLQEGMQRGEKPDAIYARMSTDHNIAWNCITGGLCVDDAGMNPELARKVYYLKQGRYLKLAARDFDHFGEHARRAYLIGHEQALNIALLAGKTQNRQELEKAYAMNAFACHFLSDRFASGHMRTPHFYLYHHVSPSTVGALLSSYMHSEDNKLGLFVLNKRGDHWKAYGDSYYFDERNQRNREILQEALQLSADEIFEVYQQGRRDETNKVMDLIPDVDAELNHSPLFVWDGKTVLRRNKLTSPDDFTHSSYWLGWATLLELIKANGIPHVSEGRLLADKETREVAIRYGIIALPEVTFT